MNKAEFLNQIAQTLLVPLLSLFLAVLVRAINMKRDQLLEQSKSETKKKYIQMLSEIITECVNATNQTYVEDLKKDNAFTKEAQKLALKKTIDNINAILSEEAKDILQDTYGDLESYILAKVEAEISNNKPRGY